MPRFVAPRTGAKEIPVGAEQLEFREYTGAIHTSRDLGDAVTIVSRWRLSEEEKARIRDGEDIYVAMVTFGGPVLPFLISIGTEELLEATDPTPEFM